MQAWLAMYISSWCNTTTIQLDDLFPRNESIYFSAYSLSIDPCYFLATSSDRIKIIFRAKSSSDTVRDQLLSESEDTAVDV